MKSDYTNFYNESDLTFKHLNEVSTIAEILEKSFVIGEKKVKLCFSEYLQRDRWLSYKKTQVILNDTQLGCIKQINSRDSWNNTFACRLH